MSAATQTPISNRGLPAQKLGIQAEKTPSVSSGGSAHYDFAERVSCVKTALCAVGFAVCRMWTALTN